MTGAERDVEFVSALERERAVLQGTAFLLIDDPISASQVLDATLARLYAEQVAPAAVRQEALRRLVRDDTVPVLLPWTPARRVELVDRAPPVETAGIVADLRGLPRDQRTVIVLERFTEVPPAEIADLLDRPIDEVLGLARQARADLTVEHPERQADHRLTGELRSAIPYGWPVSEGSRLDLTNGQRLIRRRRLRRGSVAVAAIVALVVLVAQLWPQPVTEPVALPSPTGPTPVIRASCDPNGATCRADLLEAWRSETAQVINEHLDSVGENAFGYGRSDDDAQSTSFWSGRGGALTLELVRRDQGLGEVSVQIASSREFAWTCGSATSTTCVTTRYMDGNRFTIGDGGPGHGVEVQYSPYGDQVITVVARKQGKTPHGQASTITPGDLVDLIQDRRLRLPSL